MEKRRIYIVEDHPIARIGYHGLIQSTRDMVICGESPDAEQAIVEVELFRPDLVLVDLSLPRMSGLKLIEVLHQLCPAVNILVISVHEELIYGELALRAGANGYVMKTEKESEIIHAIRRVLGNELYISPKVRERILRHHMTTQSPLKKAILLDRLTQRELDVLRLVGAGLTTNMIATQLALSPKTVESHLSRIKDKFGFEDSREMMLFAIMHFEIKRTGIK